MGAAEKKKTLEGKALVLLFQKASTRTRISLEVAINQLGGQSLFLGWGNSQISREETLADTTQVLSGYVDGIIARVNKQSDLEEMTKYSRIPVINALSNLYHPCQVISDLFTIWENKGHLENLKLTYVGDGNNVCNSLLIGCSKIGVNISVACPPGYEPYAKAVEYSKNNAQRTGSMVDILRNPIEAVKDADIIYTDTFVSMGDESEREKRLKVFLPKYQVTSKLFKHAAKDAFFMHCLPAHRNEEVTAEVIDGPRSIVWIESENRLHSTKAILEKIIK